MRIVSPSSLLLPPPLRLLLHRHHRLRPRRRHHHPPPLHSLLRPQPRPPYQPASPQAERNLRPVEGLRQTATDGEAEARRGSICELGN